MTTPYKSLAVIVLSLTACAGPRPSHVEVRSADYGERPTVGQTLALVQEYMSPRLIDPYSARYECQPPTKVWITGSYFHNVNFGGRVTYGYVALCSINAKNRLGGYTGAKSYPFVVRQRGGKGVAEMITGPVEIQQVSD